MFKFNDLQRKCCITCQFFKGQRKVEIIGRDTFIDYVDSVVKNILKK